MSNNDKPMVSEKQVSVKFADGAHDLIKDAAKKTERTITQFCRYATVKEAQKVLGLSNE